MCWSLGSSCAVHTKVYEEEQVNLITVIPVQEELSYGVRVGGLTRENLQDEAVRRQLNDLFESDGLIVFENVEPSSEMHVALSNVFGPLKEHPSKAVPRVNKDTLPGVVDIPYTPGKGGVVELNGKRLAQWLPWHFDHCYNDTLNRAGVLRALQVPPEEGRTGFVDGIELYKRLSAELREQIEGKNVLYSLDVYMGNLRFGRPEQLEEVVVKPGAAKVAEDASAMPRAIHPAVWTRNTGEKVLHVSPWMALGLQGEENERGNALLEAVCQEINTIAKTCSYFHKWNLTDMLIWDNWRWLHSVSGMDPQYPRHMQRTTIAGDYGLGCFEHEGKGGKILEMTV